MLVALQRCTQAPSMWAPPNTAQQWGRPPRTDGSLCSGSTSLSSRWATGLCFHGSSVAEQQLQHKASHSPQKNSNRRRWFGRAGTWGEVGSLQVSPPRSPWQAGQRLGRGQVVAGQGGDSSSGSSAPGTVL